MATTPRPLANYFTELRDPRVRLTCEHDFMAIILIAVCATVAGADDFVATVGICANGPRQQEIMGEICSAWIDLPAGTFKEQGTNVNTAIVVIDE